MVYIEVQDKKLKFGMKKMSYKLFRLKVIQLVLNRLKVAYQQKISRRKKAITWSFEAQIASRFSQYLKDIIS